MTSLESLLKRSGITLEEDRPELFGAVRVAIGRKAK